MGSYSTLYIDGYPLFTAKNSYIHEIVDFIFTPDDYKEFERPLVDRNEVTWGDVGGDNTVVELVHVFQCPVWACKDRLELFGASYARAKIHFDEVMKMHEDDEVYEFAIKPFITFDIYLDTLKQIIREKKSWYGLELNSQERFKDYLLEHELYVEYQSIELALWAILSVVDSEAIVEYDLTDLTQSGWLNVFPPEVVDNQKIIIFTEGKTDTQYIQSCIKLFFSHLVGFYHFIDFDNSKYEASASRLVHTIKSFVGSGITNHIIALFDNDSAAHKEISQLSKVKLPDNIRVVNYPVTELAKYYPTVGPTGVHNMDVNGLAGSIEMYLGKDCLMEGDKLSPVQWTGYIESVQKYQGSVMHKSQIQKRFKLKVRSFDANNYDESDWTDLIAIVKLINSTWQ